MLQIALLVLLATLLRPGPVAADGSCAGAVPISTARRLPPGTQVTVRGNVTVPTGAFTEGQSFAIQDATGGIYVYRRDGIGQALMPGDDVCVTGRLALFHGLLELTPASARDIVRLGGGKPPAPTPVEPARMGESTEGLFVSITGTISELGDRRFRVGGAVIYLNRNAGIVIRDLAEGCSVTVIGLSADYDGAQLWPRGQGDIVPGECQPTACTDLTIAEIQGSGSASRYEDRAGLGCVTGCVTGIGEGGFYIQSTTPDDDPLTSEGIFVYRWDGWTNPRRLRPGDLIEIRDFAVQEFYGSTEIVDLQSDAPPSYRVLGTCEAPAPIPIAPLTDPQVDPATSYERFEGMRVQMDLDGTVVGPTTRFASMLPGGTPEISLVDRNSPLLKHGRLVFASDAPPGRGAIELSGALGAGLPDVGTGDRLSARGLTGILAYQFGRYVLLVEGPQAPLIQVEDGPDPAGAVAAIGPDQFAICSFNLENLFDAVDDGDGDVGDWSPAGDAEFIAALGKRARAIEEDLRGCTVIGLQELEGKDAVWEALARAVGQSFRYDYYESADERDITTGILYDARRVAVKQTDQIQACTAGDYGVDYTMARGPRSRPNPCGHGSYPLFDRPPYVANLEIRDAAGQYSLEVRVVVNHFKSKQGDETVNRPRRIAQARYVAGLLTAPNSIALGDLNDGLGSPTLAQLDGFVNLYLAHLPEADRYTYIYNGRAEALDHFIMTRELDRYFLSGGPVHINADFPDRRVPDDTSRRSSDHDPLFVRFGFQPTAVSEALAGALTGIVVGMTPQR